ncbi:MAG: hypothetical protein NT154_01100 [Verrucomicrobia bacterium]|nr:hypothetical protein [Verrucomicrobiota bacterium]
MSPHAGFLLQDQVVPRLRSAIPNVVAFIGCEDAEELIQDGTALAAQMMHNAEQAGKKVVKFAGGRPGKTVTAGNVCYYTIEKLRCGRRSTGSSVVDVHGAGTQIKGNTRLNSLDEPAGVDEETGGELAFHDVLSRDEEDPSTKAARKMDWESFLAGLSARDQAVIEGLVEGTSRSAMARKLGVCTSTIHHRKRSLAKAIAAFMGDDILIEVRRLPRWKDDLDATKERQTVRYERSH